MNIDVSQLSHWYLQNNIVSMTLVFLGFVIFLAFVANIVTSKLKAPVIIGYVILGALFSSSVLKTTGLFSQNFFSYYAFLNRSFDYIAYITLGFVAFMIGLDLSVRLFKTLGKSILFMTLLEAFGAFFLVTTVMYLIGRPFYQALMLGAISSATAPAATVMVIKSLKAKGPLTSSILAIVGFDDAIALIIYSFAAPIAHSFVEPGATFSLYTAMLVPVFKIGMSIVVGGIVGYFGMEFLTRAEDAQSRVISLIAVVFVVTAITEHFGWSHLIGNMAAGFVVRNRAKNYLGLAEVFDIIMVPLYAIFFIMAGFKLRLTLITNVPFILVGLAYTGARLLGKIAGSSTGAILGKAPDVVKKYVGFGLLSQVGVAIALAYIVEQEFLSTPKFGSFVFNLLLFTTLFTEVIGPIMLKYALIKSGEAAGRKKE